MPEESLIRLFAQNGPWAALAVILLYGGYRLTMYVLAENAKREDRLATVIDRQSTHLEKLTAMADQTQRDHQEQAKCHMEMMAELRRK